MSCPGNKQMSNGTGAWGRALWGNTTVREVGEAWKEGEARETNGGEGSSLYHHVYKWEGADPVHMELWPYTHFITETSGSSQHPSPRVHT